MIYSLPVSANENQVAGRARAMRRQIGYLQSLVKSVRPDGDESPKRPRHRGFDRRGIGPGLDNRELRRVQKELGV